MAVKVEYDLAPVGGDSVWQGVIEEGSVWCHPKEFSFKYGMRKLYNNYGVYKKRAIELSEYVKEQYEQGKVHNQMLTAIDGEQYDLEDNPSAIFEALNS